MKRLGQVSIINQWAVGRRGKLVPGPIKNDDRPLGVQCTAGIQQAIDLLVMFVKFHRPKLRHTEGVSGDAAIGTLGE